MSFLADICTGIKEFEKTPNIPLQLRRAVIGGRLCGHPDRNALCQCPKLWFWEENVTFPPQKIAFQSNFRTRLATEVGNQQ